MILIDGKKIAAELREELRQEVVELKAKHNKVPGLTVILIGDMAPSQIYVRNKEKSANEVGLKSDVIKYPDTVEEKTILDKIEELNNDESISGILVQLPLPKHIDKQKVIETITPESIFAKSEFSIQATITSNDIDLEDITLEIIAPDIEFRGDTFYKLSSLEKQTPYTISAELITPVENVTTEYTIPVKVILTYTDDLGETNTSTQSMPLLLRPKTFMELTNDGGIWIGDFFIAPYVSIGTIVGIPAGTILSLIIRRSQNKKKESSTK